MKHTQKALLASALSLLLCFSMLIGTTFAWFTDTVTTGVNTIQSGTLDVDMVDKNGKSLEGRTLSFRDVTGSSDILWEPGAKFALDSFKIVNNGNLALKYAIVINGISGSVKLLEVIDFTVKIGDAAEVSLADFNTAYGSEATNFLLPDGAENNEDESAEIVIYGKMRESANNDYQNLTADGISITVYATQYTYEKDSIDDQYDAGAKNPTIVRDKDALVAALNSGEDIALGADIAVNGNLSLKAGATLYGGGHTLIDAQLYMDEGSSVKDVVFDGVEAETGSNIYAHGVSVTIDGCSFIGEGVYEAIQATTAVDGVSTTITGCTFDLVAPYRYVHVEVTDKTLRADANNSVKLVMTDNYFKNIDACTDDGITVCGVMQNNLTASGNVASAATVDAANDECWYGYVVVKEDGKKAWANYDVPFETILVKVSSADALKTAVSNGESVSLTEDITLPNETSYITVSNGATVDVDMNGHTITATETKNGFAFRVESGATLNLSNGNIVSNGYAVFSGANQGVVNSIVIDNVNISSHWAGVYHNGSYYGADITIKNSTITAASVGVWLSGSASWGSTGDRHNLVIENCKISGETGVEVMYTDAKITDSTLTSLSEDEPFMDLDGGASADGFALALTHQPKENASLGIIEVTNCTLNGAYGIQAEGASVTTVNTDTAAINVK